MMASSDRKRKADGDIWESGVIKAVVSEQNGEISCSVEETNRIRALLGLKPLVIAGESEEHKAVKNFKQKQEEEKKLAESEAIRARLEQAKTKRLLNASLGGQSLGAVAEAESDLVSAADWVQRSRQKQITEKEKAREAARRLDEADAAVSLSRYTSSELKGVQVMHGAQDFEVGEEVILTLADSSILDVDDNGKMIGLNVKTDVLENVNFSDRDRRLEREQRLKRLRQPIYAGHDDHEFANDQQTRSLLPQYDAEKKVGPRLVLGDEGTAVNIDGSNPIKESVINEKKANALSLATELKDVQDFYSPAEYATFAKSKNKGEKKKRKIRKKLDDDDGESGVGGMIAYLEAELEENSASASAVGTSATSSASSTKPVVSNLSVVGPSKRTSALLEDDDADLQRAVAMSRKLALLQQAQQESVTNEPEDVGARFARDMSEKSRSVISGSRMEEENSTGAGYYGTAPPNHHPDTSDELKFDEIDAEGRRADGSLIFTSTTEFTTRLQARLNEKARARAEAAVRAAAASERPDDFGAAAGSSAASMDVEIEDQESDEDMSANGDMPGADEQLDFVHQQPLVASGMAATLALLKGSGELNKKAELAGRAKDSRDVDPSARDSSVKIEYRDEDGRLLTQKEAFRQLCYRFHGIKPSKKKAEKRLAALEAQNKAMSSHGVLDSGTMRSLLKTQEATGKAHVTVQGGLAGMASAADLAASIAKGKPKPKESGSSSSVPRR